METPEVYIDKSGLREHYLTLTECQRPFVHLLIDWYRKPRKMFIVVSGGPGTGKSYVVKNTLDYVKTEQLRMSYTARSAHAIGGRTIHSSVQLDWTAKSLSAALERKLKDEESLEKAIEESMDIRGEFHCSGYPRIIVIDEVSMINGWLIYHLVHYLMDRTTLPVLFVVMGDPHQLNPVRSIHNLFNITFNEKLWDVKKIHLKESKRFTPEYEGLINRLRKFVDDKDADGLFGFVCQHFPVVESIDWSMVSRANRAMAYRNDRVKTFNTFYVNKMMEGPEIVIQEDLVVKPDCLVYVTKNGVSKAMNGTQLIFKRFENDIIYCMDPKSNAEIEVHRDYETGKFFVDLGFAATIHKYQGDTIDNDKIIIHFDGNRNLNLVYTALSRVRQMDQILAIEL